jgi:carbonic anhydrase
LTFFAQKIMRSFFYILFAALLSTQACTPRLIDTVHTREQNARLGPGEVLDMLKQGNKRFVNGHPLYYNYPKQVALTAAEQAPSALVLTCMDSRVAPEIIFNQGLGELFTVRVAGNVVSPEILGSMEYACGHAGTQLIVVLGHTRCGAVTGACAHFRHPEHHSEIPEPGLEAVFNDLRPAVEQAEHEEGADNEATLIEHAVVDNVLHDIRRIRTESPELAALEHAGHIAIVGAVYDVATGKVVFLKEVEVAH